MVVQAVFGGGRWMDGTGEPADGLSVTLHFSAAKDNAFADKGGI